MMQWRLIVPLGIALVLWAVLSVRPSPSGDFLLSSAASRSCRPTAAERAATEIAITSYPTEVPTPTPVTAPIVTTELAIIAEGQDIPLLLPSVVIRAPKDQRPELGALVELSRPEPSDDGFSSLFFSIDANPFQLPVKEILINADDSVNSSDFGLLRDERDEKGRQLKINMAINERPIVGVGENGTLTVVIPQPSQLLSDSVDKKLIRLRPDEGKKAVIAGGWTVNASGPAITAHFEGNVDTRTEWHVGVCAAGLQIDSVRMDGTPAPGDPTSAILLATSPTPVATSNASDSALPPVAQVSATPILQSLDSGMVRWMLPPTSGSVTVDVAARVPLWMALRLWFVTGWRQDYTAMAAFLMPVGLLLASLFLIPRTAALGGESALARARLVSGSWAIVRLSIAAALTIIFFSIDLESSIVQANDHKIPVSAAFIALCVVALGFIDFPLSATWGTKRSTNDLALGLIAAIAIGWTLCFAEIAPLKSFTFHSLAIPVFLVAAYSMMLATAARLWRYRNDSTIGSYPLMTLPTIGALSLLSCIVFRWHFVNRIGDSNFWLFVDQLLVPIWIIVCAIVGVCLLVAAPLAGLWQSIPGARNLPRPVRTVVLLVVIGVNFILLAQWAWANYATATIWARERTDVTDLDIVFRQVLSERLFFFPVSLLLVVLGFPLILGLTGFVGVLAGVGRERQTLFFRADQRWIRSILIVLFATFVVSYGSGGVALQSLLTFVVGIVLLALAWSDRIRDTSCQIDVRNGATADGEPVIVSRRGDLLHRATVLADLERRRVKARRDLEDGTLSPQDYFPTICQLEAQASTVRQGSNAADTASEPEDRRDVPLPTTLNLGPHDVPAALALAVGPEKSWWANGVLAVRLGAVLAVLPIAYFMFVFLGSRGGVEWAFNSPFAMLEFATALIYETAFWLVAALVFGCVFPYLYGPNGPVTGTVLAAIYVGANALAALVGTPGNALWQVRAFQLLLFLILLGTWLNLKTVEDHGLRWRDLMAMYDLPKRTTIVSQALPLVAAIAGVIVQLLLGQTQQATENLVSGDASKALLDFFRGQN